MSKNSHLGHQAKKRFGQNFLHNDAVISDIVDAINPEPNENLIEIGPGLGALTEPVIERAGELSVVELDRDLAHRLRHHPFLAPKLTIYEEDALKSLFKLVRKKMKVAGCQRAIIVAHNAAFDLGFVNAATERCLIKRSPFHPFVSFDTTTLSGLALGQTVLAKACATAGIDFNNSEAHSALYDTEKTAELYCYIVNKWQQLGGWPLADTTDEADSESLES